MAVGLLIGTEHLDDFDGYIKTIEAVGKIFDKFKSHFGTVKCFEIQEKILSRHYDFWKTEDVQAWYKEGGLDACPGVCAIAARIGAEVILILHTDYHYLRLQDQTSSSLCNPVRATKFAQN